MFESWEMSPEMKERIQRRAQRRGAKKLKKLKAARRKLSALKPYPRTGYGELMNLSGKTYQVQKNGEWRLVKDFTKLPEVAAKQVPVSFEQSISSFIKANS